MSRWFARGVVHPDQNSSWEEGKKTKKGKEEERRKEKEKEKLPHLASPKHTKFIIIILCTRESQFLTLSQFSSSLHIHQEC